MTTEIRRGIARFLDRAPGRSTHHAFSFGAHYDPERTAFGPMVCHDDHLLGAGRGFETHRHAGLDVVSYVVAGTLQHTDSASGSTRSVPAGSVAWLHAGDGVEHSETASAQGVCRFVQVWLTAADGPDADPTPSYAVTDEPVLVVGGARLEVVRLGVGEERLLPPAAPLLHVFVATGALVRSSLAEPLTAGDAFLMTEEPAYTVTAAVPTELLVWSLPA